MEKRKLTQIHLNHNNPRLIKDEAFKRLVESIKSFPKMLEIKPIVIDDLGEILAGNQRYRACKELGMKEVPVLLASDLTEEQKQEFIVRDNTHYGEWDFNILSTFHDAETLEEWGVPVWPSGDIEPIDLTSKEAKEDDFEAPPIEQVKTDIKYGDIIQIGNHRLMCGDSTKQEDVERLMDGEKADMVFTDPPYGVSYQSNMRTESQKFDVLLNDNEFIVDWIPLLDQFSTGFIFVWTSWKVVKKWIELLEVHFGDPTNFIVWDKGGGGIGDLEKTFLTDFEIALTYHRGSKITGKRLGSVWEVGKDAAVKYLHPTQKPISLSALAIENTTLINFTVLDLFLGSGSTMVACHQLGRICYGMELEPKYCQVIVDRMKKLDPSIEVRTL